PEPARDIIQALNEKQILPTAMMDISDGLSSELHHIAKQSGVGIQIFEEKLPIHEQTRFNAERFGIAATTAALNGGEDYELIFTVAPEHFAAITQIPSVAVIGDTTAPDAGVKLITTANNRVDIQAQGWNPLKK
ncbi:MAG: thiamine-phosphate kinase, partial [Chitinophagaceae bacterium]|nr:thiamine-phosphate kinase [Chitinophagaceae bacterium]